MELSSLPLSVAARDELLTIAQSRSNGGGENPTRTVYENAAASISGKLSHSLSLFLSFSLSRPDS